MNSNLYSSEKTFYVIVIIMAIFFGICFVIGLVTRTKEFLEIRKYIKDEMSYSTGHEYLYWKHKLKKLYLTSIPFIGWFFRGK